MKAKAQGKIVTAVSSITAKPVSLDRYFRQAVKGQDLNQWKKDPDNFNTWLRAALKSRIDTLDFTVEDFTVEG